MWKFTEQGIGEIVIQKVTNKLILWKLFNLWATVSYSFLHNFISLQKGFCQPACRGLWLDKGLWKLIKVLTTIRCCFYIQSKIFILLYIVSVTLKYDSHYRKSWFDDEDYSKTFVHSKPTICSWSKCKCWRWNNACYCFESLYKHENFVEVNESWRLASYICTNVSHLHNLVSFVEKSVFQQKI